MNAVRSALVEAMISMLNNIGHGEYTPKGTNQALSVFWYPSEDLNCRL